MWKNFTRMQTLKVYSAKTKNKSLVVELNMKRNCEVRIKVSSEELIKLKQKSKELGMSLSVYLRWLGLTASFKVEAI